MTDTLHFQPAKSERAWTQRETVIVAALGIVFAVLYLAWVQLWLLGQAAIGPLSLDIHQDQACGIARQQRVSANGSSAPAPCTTPVSSATTGCRPCSPRAPVRRSSASSTPGSASATARWRRGC